MITSPHSEFKVSGKFQACTPETHPAPPPEFQTHLYGSAIPRGITASSFRSDLPATRVLKGQAARPQIKEQQAYRRFKCVSCNCG